MAKRRLKSRIIHREDKMSRKRRRTRNIVDFNDVILAFALLFIMGGTIYMGILMVNSGGEEDDYGTISDQYVVDCYLEEETGSKTYLESKYPDCEITEKDNTFVAVCENPEATIQSQRPNSDRLYDCRKWAE